MFRSEKRLWESLEEVWEKWSKKEHWEGRGGAPNASAIHAVNSEVLAATHDTVLDLQEKPSSKIFIGGLPQDDAGLLC